MKQEFTAIVNGKEYAIILDEETASINNVEVKPDICKNSPNRLHALINHKSYNVELVSVNREEKLVTLMVNNNKYTVSLIDKYDHLLKSLGMDSLNSKKLNELKAPMPGLVIDVRVSVGDTIEKGDPLLVLEAMKMENILKAPGPGRVKKINVSKGEAVEKNTVLISFE